MKIRAAALMLLFSLSSVAQDTELVDGSVVPFALPDIPAGQVSVQEGLFIDVPADATSLLVTFNEPGGRDVDVLLRRTPFPDTADIGALFNDADYYSGGIGGDEFVTIIDSTTPPVGGERWHLSLIHI